MPDGIVYLNQPHIQKIAGTDPAILDTDPLAFTAKVSVDLFFENSEKPQYLDLVVVKNGDKTNVQTIKANISSYPSEVELTGRMLTDLFGETIVSGDKFDIGANYITGGKTYLVFPMVGQSYGATVTSQPGASPTVSYSAICGFLIDDFLGDGKFEVVSDAWGDYAGGTIVSVTKTGANEFSIESSDPAFNDFLVKVNPADNSATIASQLIGSEAAVTSVYGGGGAYGSLTASTGGAVSASFVNPCNNEIQLNVQYVLSKYGNQGAYILKLKKI